MRWIIGLIFSLASLIAFASNTYEYRLHNGLKLIVREDHRSPVVVSTVWYRVGGSYEHGGITGISHMLEHLMFKGTLKYKPGEFIRMISQNGGLQNAMTSADYTMYYEQLSADKIALSFELEADRMNNLLFRQDLYTKEHEVVMEERRTRVDDSPKGFTWECFNATAFINSPYHHPTIGWMTDVKNLTINDLSNWYKEWYAPNNATVVVVGDVQAAKVYKMAKKYFGAIQAVHLSTLKPRQEAPSMGMRKVVVEMPAKIPWLLIGYHVPTLKTASAQWKVYALAMLLGVLNSGASARLSKDLIRGQQLAVSVGGQYDLYSLHNNLFVLYGTPAEDHTVKELRRALLQEVDRLKTIVVTPAEMRRVKAQVIADNIYHKDSMMRQACDIALPEIIGLSWRESDAFVARIKAVSPEQIRRVAKEFFKPENLIIGVLKPHALSEGENHA